MNFTTKNNLPEELERVQLLESLIKKYKVPEFTYEIIVEKGVIPHSHPVLTMNTRKQSDINALEILIHEQFHWYSSNHPNQKKCIEYLKTKYKDDGEHNKSGKYPDSYWSHIIVCFNTRNWLKKILSEEEIESIHKEWSGYKTLEEKITDNFDHIKSELEQFEMVYVERSSENPPNSKSF